MSVILNIDTALNSASVSISENGTIVNCLTNTIQKQHATFLHPAIEEIIRSSGKKLDEIDAIAVTAGPGSYTGIRVGMASAKGFSLALNIPLITINTLELLAKDIILHRDNDPSCLFCPMIDARRNEVYSGICNIDLKWVLTPCAIILEKYTYAEFLKKSALLFFGNGSLKLEISDPENKAKFIENVNIPAALSMLTFEKYLLKSFSDKAYSEPYYLKEFYNGL